MKYPKGVRAIAALVLSALINSLAFLATLTRTLLFWLVGAPLFLPVAIVALVFNGGNIKAMNQPLLVAANVIFYAALFYGLLGFSEKFGR
jgi:hypothetical protein